jgi:hypothetical protein
MKSSFFVPLFLFCLAPQVFADETITTTVADVIQAESSNKYDVHRLLTMHNGLVLKVKNNKDGQSILDAVASAKKNQKLVQLKYTDTYFVSSAKMTAHEALREEVSSPESVDESDFSFQDLGYQPTVLGTMNDAEYLFQSLETHKFRKSSECFQRAHIWSYGLNQGRSIKSMKVFIFYSRQYIKRYDFKWWFHVAPYVHVQQEEVVLDATFLKAARPMQKWVNHFASELYNEQGKTDVECKVMTKYSDYQENSGWCYLAKVPMYFYQPLDIENYEKTGEADTYFAPQKVQMARKAYKWTYR